MKRQTRVRKRRRHGTRLSFFKTMSFSLYFPLLFPSSFFFFSSFSFFTCFSFFLLTPGSFSSDNNAVEQPRRGRWSGMDALSWLYIRGVALLAPEAPPGFVGWHAAHRINRDRRTADFYGINGVKTTPLRLCGRVRPPAILYVRT